MTDDTIQVTESGQTNLQAYTGTVAGKSVKAEAAVLVDSNNSPYDPRQIRALTATDVVTAQGQSSLANWFGVKIHSDGTNPASVINTAPTTQYAVVTRNIPSGTQTVSGTVTANQGTAGATGWPVKVTDGTNTLTPVLDQLDNTTKVGIAAMGVNLAGSFGPLPLDTLGQTVPTSFLAAQPVFLQGVVSGASILSSQNSVATASLVSASGTPQSIGFEVTGTWAGVFVFEAEVNATWTQIMVYDLTNDVYVTTTSVNGSYIIPTLAGVSQVRMRLAFYISGTATIVYAAMQGATFTGTPWYGQRGQPAPARTVSVGGVDLAGNLRGLPLDINGNLQTSDATVGTQMFGASPWSSSSWTGSW